MPSFKFATFAAVSTDRQADEDKGSLDDQIETARRAGEQQGGEETAGPFILDGYSRTGYVNLSDALEDIPPLAEALEAAAQDQYDVLIVDNIERMDTQNIYGGGDWFVLGEHEIWYVKNNGMDGDDWLLNNVRTGGAGAIGWMIPMDSQVEYALLCLESDRTPSSYRTHAGVFVSCETPVED